MSESLEFLRSTGRRCIEDQDEYIPTLIVESPSGEYQIIALAGGHPFDMLTAILPMLRSLNPVSMSLTVDSYILTAAAMSHEEADALYARYEHSLAAAFAAGEPAVSEALVITMVTPTSHRVVTMPYRRGDDGVTWDDDHEIDSDEEGAQTEGRLVEVLRAVWRRR